MSFLIKSLSLFDTLKKSANQGSALIPSIGKDCQAAQWYHRAPCEPYGMALMELIPTYSACVTRIRILLPHWKDISQKQGEGRLGDTQRRVLYHVAYHKRNAAVLGSSGNRLQVQARGQILHSRHSAQAHRTNLQQSKSRPLRSREWPAVWHTPSKQVVLVELFTHPVLYFHPRLSDMGTGDTHPQKADLSRSDAAKYSVPLVPFQPLELSLRQSRPTLDFGRNRMRSCEVSVAAERILYLTKIRYYGPSQPILSSLNHYFD